MKDAKYGTLREETLPSAFVAASQNAKPSDSATFDCVSPRATHRANLRA